MHRNGARKYRSGNDANLLLLTFMSCHPCLPNFQCFKVVYHEHPFAFSSSAMSVMP